MGMRGGWRRCSCAGSRRRASRRVDGRERSPTPASQVRSPGNLVAQPSEPSPLAENRGRAFARCTHLRIESWGTRLLRGWRNALRAKVR
jgi:hypothetical protein